jgi:hypothetical protein
VAVVAAVVAVVAVGAVPGAVVVVVVDELVSARLAFSTLTYSFARLVT